MEFPKGMWCPFCIDGVQEGCRGCGGTGRTSPVGVPATPGVVDLAALRGEVDVEVEDPTFAWGPDWAKVERDLALDAQS